MAAGDIHVADLLDTEMDSVIRSHCIYKSMWLPLMGEQLVLEKEPASQSTLCSGNDNEFLHSGPHSIRKIIHRSHGIFTQMGSVIHVCHITGRRRKGKGLEALCK